MCLKDHRAPVKPKRFVGRAINERSSTGRYTVRQRCVYRTLKEVYGSNETRQVKGPQEATLDSHFLLMASTMGAQKARTMKSGSGLFDIDDFVAKLVKR